MCNVYRQGTSSHRHLQTSRSETNGRRGCGLGPATPAFIVVSGPTGHGRGSLQICPARALRLRRLRSLRTRGPLGGFSAGAAVWRSGGLLFEPLSSRATTTSSACHWQSPMAFSPFRSSDHSTCRRWPKTVLVALPDTPPPTVLHAAILVVGLKMNSVELSELCRINAVWGN